LERMPSRGPRWLDGRGHPRDVSSPLAAAGVSSSSLQVRQQNAFTLDTSAKAGPNFGLHEHGGAATHRHGWQMQGLSRPQLPAAARGRPQSAPPPGPWVSKPTPDFIARQIRASAPPPIAAELEEAGLAHLAPKLVQQFSCSTVEQLLRLSATELQTLLDQMRLIPGQRQAIIDWLEKKRTVPRPKGKLKGGKRMDSEWTMTKEAVRRAAAQRARSTEFGPRAELTAEPHINWGRTRGEKERLHPSTAYISDVRVLTVGRHKLTVHGGYAHFPHGDHGNTLKGMAHGWAVDCLCAG